MIGEAQLVVGLLVLTRVSSFVAFFSLFSKRQLPNLVKFGLATSLSIFWYSEIQASLAPSIQDITNPILATMLVVKEVAIGILLATCLGVFFWPARVAGAYVGQELGLSLASISDPASQDSSTLVTRIFEMFATLLFFGLNLHHLVVIVLHISFQNLNTRIAFHIPTEQVTTMLTSVADRGLLIVAPLVCVLMLVTLVLALLNKAAPTLNLFSVGMSLRAGLGVFCLFVFSPILFHALQVFLYRFQGDIEDLIARIG